MKQYKLHKMGVRIIALCLVCVLQTSCASETKKFDPASDITTQNIYEDEKAKPGEGSLWPGETSKNLLFADTKAKEVGDVVTVLIDETATSSQTATTQTEKQTDIDFNTPNVLGLPPSFGVNNFLNKGNPLDLSIQASTDRSNAGAGTTTRQGTLTGTVAVIVTQVLPNGNLKIEGKRSVTVNNEEQFMVLTGLIRPVDINFNNTISSQLIANASITYSGEGIVADQQREGWATRILGWIWPF